MDKAASSPVKPKRTRLAKEDRARQLLDIAEELFVTRGYENTTLEDVVKVAGVTRPIVYEHYGSKEGLFLACAARARTQFEAELVAAVLEVAAQPQPKIIEQAADIFFKVLEENPKRWALLFGSTVAPSSDLATGLAELRTRTIDKIAALIRMQAPNLDDEAVSAAAYAISGVGEQLGRWWLRQSHLPRQTVVQHYTTFVVGGVNAVQAHAERAVAAPKASPRRPSRKKAA